MIYINNIKQTYEHHFTFREEISSGKMKEDILEKRTICEEPEFNKYELLTEKCLYIHKEL